MSLEIKESDWKAFKKAHPVALTRYFDRAAAKIERLMAQNDKTSQERFWDAANFIKESVREASDLFDGSRRSRAAAQLMMIFANELLTAEEMAGFSPELRARVESNRGFQADHPKSNARR